MDSSSSKTREAAQPRRDKMSLVLVFLLFICFICGFCIAIPVALSQDYGGCPLYASVSLNVTGDDPGDCTGWAGVTGGGSGNSRDTLLFHPGTSMNCGFIEGVSALFAIVYSAAVIAFQIFLFIKGSNGIPFLDKKFGLVRFILCCFDATALFLLLVAASVLSEGTAQWCDALLTTCRVPWYISCEEFMKLLPGVDESFDFYSHLYTAEVAIWLCFMIWLVITIIGFLGLWRMGGIPCLPEPSDSSPEAPPPPGAEAKPRPGGEGGYPGSRGREPGYPPDPEQPRAKHTGTRETSTKTRQAPTPKPRESSSDSVSSIEPDPSG